MKLSACCLSVCAALSLPISAQPFEAPEASPEANIEVIVVQGEKINRSLQETTSSTSVFTEQSIQDTGSDSIYDLFNMASNVNAINGDYGFTIRGIQNTGISGTSDVASVYIDGAVVGSSTTRRAGLSIFDLEAVEILKGPQSTTQGRNALAGAVHLRTVEADYDFDGKGMLAADDNGGYNAAVAQNVILVEDKLTARVVLDKYYNKGFVENVTQQDDAWDKDDLLTARVKVRYDISEDIVAKLNLTKVDKKFGSEVMYKRESLGTLDLFERKTYQNGPMNTVQDEEIVVFTLDYAINDAWSLTSATNFSKVAYTNYRDSDSTDLNSFEDAIYDFREYAFSHEFKANYYSDKINSVFALYHSNIRSDSDNKRSTLIQVPFGPAVVPLLLKYHLQDNIQNENFAFYTSNDITINEKWRMNIGLRYDREDVNTLSINDPTRLNNLGPFNDMVDVLIADSTSPGMGDSSYNVFLPRASISYNVTPDINVSAIYSTGYRSGGLSVNIARGEAVPYDAEYNDTYELAFRSTWLDKQLTINANAFYYDWKDQQVNINRSPRPFDSEVRNAGQSTLSGIETDIIYYVNDDWKIHAAFGYNKTEFEDFKSFDELTGQELFNYDGNEFPGTSKYNGSITSTYRFNESWFVNTSMTYRDKYFSRAENEFIVPTLTQVNVRVGYETSDWDVYLNISNLFDRETKISEFEWQNFVPEQNQPDLTQGTIEAIQGGELNDPRVISMSFNYRW